jgi:recombination protein RecT
MSTNTQQLTPVQRLKNALSAESVKEQFKNALADSAPLFVASLIDIYASDRNLQECEPGAVIMEALKAATLRLPINKNLGFAYIVPYRNRGKMEPQMQIGYKGLIQLAMRTGEYRYLNADVVYEGELKGYDKLTGHLDLSGEKKSDRVVGYFAYLELLNGFSKAVYWTKEQVIEHAKRFSKAFNSDYSPWKTDFDAMALKTVLRNLITKWGIMSVEMVQAVDRDIEADAQREIAEYANSEVLDIDDGIVDAEFEEVPAKEQPKKKTKAKSKTKKEPEPEKESQQETLEPEWADDEPPF